MGPNKNSLLILSVTAMVLTGFCVAPAGAASILPATTCDSVDAINYIVSHKGGSFSQYQLVSYHGGKVSCSYSYDKETSLWKISVSGKTKSISMNDMSSEDAARILYFIYYVDKLHEIYTQEVGSLVCAVGGILCLAGTVLGMANGLAGLVLVVGGSALLLASVIMLDQIEENKNGCIDQLQFYYEKIISG